MDRLPSLFVGHGAPTAALNMAKAAPWRAWGQRLPRPKAILVVSAHWEDAPVVLGATETLPLIYDFYGFPRPLYEVTYGAPGAPELAEQVTEALEGEVRREPGRGLDHGAWVPLLHLSPAADVPVLQISLPSRLGPEGVFELGRTLAPLREEGVLLLGSGNVTHNLAAMGPDGGTPPGWAVDFDAWVADTVRRQDWDELVAYRDRGPAFATNHPTEEHWLPLVFTAGTATDIDGVAFPVAAWEFTSLSRRAVQLG